MAPAVLLDHQHPESNQQELGRVERNLNEFVSQDQKARFTESLQNDLFKTALGESGTSSMLISSPYLESTHHLDLTTLDSQSRFFARALALMEPTGPDYAVTDYTAAFNWPAIMGALQHHTAEARQPWKRQSFYTVIFRSLLSPTVDRDLLHRLDKESHREATVSGGLLKYWFGVPNAERRNLATCLWRNREDARKGGTGPWHKKARLAAKELYEKIEFTTWEFVIEDGVSGWSLRKA